MHWYLTKKVCGFEDFMSVLAFNNASSYYIYNPRDFKYRAWHPLVVRGVCKNHLLKPDETFCTWKSINMWWKWHYLHHESPTSWPLKIELKSVQRYRLIGDVKYLAAFWQNFRSILKMFRMLIASVLCLPSQFENCTFYRAENIHRYCHLTKWISKPCILSGKTKFSMAFCV